MKTWQDLGNDMHKLTITSDKPGVPQSVYKGTLQEIANMLAESQTHANERITELRSVTPNGHVSQPSAAARTLTPEERLKTVTELDNPATVDTAITRVVESQIGPLSEFRERQNRQDATDLERRVAEVAAQWASDEPEWYGSLHNQNAMVKYIELNCGEAGLAIRGNYDRAFAELSALGLLQTRPASEGEPPLESEESDLNRNGSAPKAVVPKTPPARISTGVTSRDISGVPPRPGTRLKYSREQLAAMGAAEYKSLMMSDGAELLKCEKYYAEHPVQVQRRA